MEYAGQKITFTIELIGGAAVSVKIKMSLLGE